MKQSRRVGVRFLRVAVLALVAQTLVGTGAAQITFAPPDIGVVGFDGNFGLVESLEPLTRSFEVRRLASHEVSFTPRIEGGDASAFRLSTQATITLESRDSAILTVTLEPPSTGYFSSKLVLDLLHSGTVSLTLQGFVHDGFGSVEGFVLAADGSSITCAAVEIEAPLGIFRQLAVVDRFGYFRSDALPEGPYEIRSYAGGYFASLDDIDVPPNRPTYFDAVLQEEIVEARWLRGRVLQTDGEVVGGVRVALTSANSGFVRRGLSSYTCAAGAYELPLPDLDPPLRLRVHCDGYWSATMEFDPDAGPLTELDVTVQRVGEGSDVLGLVVDAETGTPLADAQVLLSNGVFTRSAETGLDGAFSLSNVIEGPARIWAVAPGYAYSPVQIDVGEEDSRFVGLAPRLDNTQGCAAGSSGARPYAVADWLLLLATTAMLLSRRRWGNENLHR